MAAYVGFEPIEIRLDAFRFRWLPELTGDRPMRWPELDR